MAGYEIELKGWKGVVFILVFLGFLVARFLTFRDGSGEAGLLRQLRVLLQGDYHPGEEARLQEACEAGDEATLALASRSVAAAELNIESVETSSPLLDLGSGRDVVVKVAYSLRGLSGTRDRRTRYYLFRYGSLGHTWQYRHETGMVRYYLNFL